MTAPGNYPAIHTGGLAVIPIEHQTLLSAGLREKERGSGSGSGSGPYSGWPYRGTIQITNPVSIANYQHYLSLPWLPGMKFDFSDIRFTQQDGTICPYWIETYTSKTHATVWIKIPSANQRQIILWYGNSRAASESSGSLVFDFFDDFPGSSLDTDKWVESGTYSVSGSLLTLGPSSTSILYSETGFTNNYAIVGKGTITGVTKYGKFGFHDSSNYGVVFQTNYPTTNTLCALNRNPYPTESSSNLGTSYTGSRRWEVIRNSTTNVIYKIDGSTVATIATSVPTTRTLYACIEGYSDQIVFDWILVRKYTATEPTLTLKQYGPRPDAQIIYYPFLPSPLAALGGLKYDELIELAQTMTGETPTISLRPLINLTQTMIGSKPITDYYPAVISPTQTMKIKVFAKIFLNLSLVRTKSITISKSIQDTLWRADISLHQYKNLDMTVLRHCTYATTDHNGVSRTLFTGILPGNQPQLAPAEETSRITGYDYAWFLTQRKVPGAYLHNTAATNPATVVTGLLGGNDWMSETGIEPYSIQTVDEWGDTLNTRVFDFDRTTSRIQAIQRICDYCRYVFIVKWRDIGGILNPCAYFCHEDDIDTYLDLPAEVTFTKPDPYVDDKITWDVKGDERYNRVTVYGRESNGASISFTAETPDVTNGDEIPVEFVESSGAFTTAAQVQARAEELLDYFSTEAKTYTVVLKNRVDLELLQKVRFIGWTEIPETSMRIISIAYTIDDATATKKVQIQVTSETKLSQIRRMYRGMNPDPLSEAEALFDVKAASMPGNDVGTITAINDDGTEATVLLEDGRTVTARII